MKKLLLLTTIVIGFTTACSNASEPNKTDKASSETLANDTSNNQYRITQKITPSIWVETKDAKAVADYYLSIFKDGKLKDYRQYKNPPEAGGGNFETATIAINGMELNILAARFLSSMNRYRL